MPILTNPLTHEPYIPLSLSLSPSHPDINIILTPPRPPNPADRTALLTLLNDPAIYMNLESTPVPYLPAHADAYLQAAYEDARWMLSAGGGGGGMPFFCIRDVAPSGGAGGGGGEGVGEEGIGEGRLIGNVSLSRYGFYEFKRGSRENEAAKARNMALPAGSEEIIWGFGDYLSPAYHGRGIMTAAIEAVIREWAIPVLNARVLKASAYADNVASVRVFEKNGFQMECELEDWAIVPENRGGGLKSIVVLRWTLNEREGVK